MTTDRYHRQMLLPGIGPEGQARLRASHALIVGCGALGSVLADTLGRAGVGTLTIVDRDVVELTNLQRQVLFDEADVAAGMPKAEAARRALQRINREVTVNAVVAHFDHRTGPALVADADLILDGLDNFETRYLLNDLAVRDARPYVYGGAVATGGMTMTILPHRAHARTGADAARPSSVAWTDEQCTPCLRCIFPDAPPAGTGPTCDTAGVLAPIVSIVASLQAAEALKLLAGHPEAINRQLRSIDIWRNDFRGFDVAGARRDDACPCCGQGHFSALDGADAAVATALCGRRTMQLTPPATDRVLDLAAIAERLAPFGAFTATPFLLRGAFRDERTDDDDGAIELTLFPDGRALFHGITRPEHARALYARYLGG